MSVLAAGTDADRRSADRSGGSCLTTGSMCSKPLTWERHGTFSGCWGRSSPQEAETWPTVGLICEIFVHVAIRVSAVGMCRTDVIADRHQSFSEEDFIALRQHAPQSSKQLCNITRCSATCDFIAVCDDSREITCISATSGAAERREPVER